jgi:hypothetical protein
LSPFPALNGEAANGRGTNEKQISAHPNNTVCRHCIPHSGQEEREGKTQNIICIFLRMGTPPVIESYFLYNFHCLKK